MQGKVSAVHSISITTTIQEYRLELYDLIKEADMHIVSCPTAGSITIVQSVWRLRTTRVTPVDEMIPRGINVAFGTDNINDIYKPFL